MDKDSLVQLNVSRLMRYRRLLQKAKLTHDADREVPLNNIIAQKRDIAPPIMHVPVAHGTKIDALKFRRII